MSHHDYDIADSRSSFTIRTMTRNDLATALQWAADEGWNPGLSDATSFYAADPDGFFLGELQGEPIACISGVRYNKSFGFIGLYIVKSGYRGQGYGIAMWNHAMKYLDGCNVGLDGVLAQQANYAKSGFRLAHRNIRYELSPSDSAERFFPLQIGSDQTTLCRLSDIDPERLNTYDYRFFLHCRSAFLNEWISQPGAFSFAAVDLSGEMHGYTVMRPCYQGFKIAPLFADCESVAEKLFLKCLEKSGERTVYLDIPEPNHAAFALVNHYGMKPMFETARMYTIDKPPLPLQCIYGVSSFELG